MPSTDRRAFLRLLGLGTTSYFFAPAAGWVRTLSGVHVPAAASGNVVHLVGASQFVTPEWIIRTALNMLNDNLEFAKCVNRGYDRAYDDERSEILVGKLPHPRYRRSDG